MAGKLVWNVYKGKERVAACLDAECAAALVAILGDGAQVRFGTWVCWTQGKDGDAGQSYDEAAAFMHGRARAAQRANYDKKHGAGAFDAALARITPSA